MYNSYNELEMIKELFATKKVDVNKLFDCIQMTKSGDLLYFFPIKVLDRMSHIQIVTLMSEYKSAVVRNYSKKTTNKILQSILDYCSDSNSKPESVIKIGVKDLDWLLSIQDKRICSVNELKKDRFKLAPDAIKALLKFGGISQIKSFADELTDKDYEKFLNDRIDLVYFMKKPTAEMLERFYAGKHFSLDMPITNTYSTRLLMTMIQDRQMTKDILKRNSKRYNGLLEVYEKLVRNSSYNTDYGIEQSGITELINYASLVNDDRELIKEYVETSLKKVS